MNRLTLSAITLLFLLFNLSPAVSQDTTTVFLESKDKLINCLAFSKGGSQIAYNDGNSVQIRNVADGSILALLGNGHSDRVLSLDFSEDSSKVVSGGRDSLVILWDNKGTLIRKLTYHKGKVTAVKFDPSGNLIYSGSTDKRIICYSLSEDKIIFESKVHTNDILSLDISRNGKLIASGGADGMVYIHDTGKGDVINNIDNNKIWVRSVKFNSNSTRLAIGNDNGSIQCWSIIDPLNIKLLTKTRYSRGWVTGLDFFPDNSSIVYSYENGLIGLNTNNTDYKLKLKVPLRMIEIQPGNSPFFVIAAASYGNGLMLIKGSSIDK